MKKGEKNSKKKIPTSYSFIAVTRINVSIIASSPLYSDSKIRVCINIYACIIWVTVSVYPYLDVK